MKISVSTWHESIQAKVDNDVWDKEIGSRRIAFHELGHSSSYFSIMLCLDEWKSLKTDVDKVFGIEPPQEMLVSLGKARELLRSLLAGDAGLEETLRALGYPSAQHDRDAMDLVREQQEAMDERPAGL